MVDPATSALLGTVLTVMGVSLVAMVIIPVLPGQFIIWLAAFVYGLMAGWEAVGWPVLIFLTLLMIIASIADIAVSWWGAQKGGASNRAILTGCLVGTIGLIFFNALGALAGGLLGIIGYEYLDERDWRHAFRAGGGYLAGLVASLVVRFFIALAMVALFAWRTL